MKQAFKILAVAALIAVFATAAAVLPGWVPLFPRVVQRRLTEGLLRCALLLYVALGLAAFVGTPWFGRRTLGAWRRKQRGARAERLFLLCLSCLFSFVVLELGAAALHAWTHRFPNLPTSFAPGPADGCRIAVLGGSSALGEPYRPWISVGQIVAWKLGQAAPGRRVEAEILAWLGDSLEDQHQKLARITERPDVVIVYSGHNEFTARFEVDRDYSLALEPRAAVLRKLHQFSLASPFCRLVYELTSKNRLDTPPLMSRRQLIEPPLCSPTEALAILADFSDRMEAIVSYCDRIGALPILVIPPANEADYEPNRSTVAPDVDQAERRRIVAEVAEARAVEAADPARAEAILRAILDRRPEFAEAHYRLGEVLETAGRVDDARERFRSALDFDAAPNRCTRPFRDVYRQVAARHPGCILIDGPSVLAQASPSGLLDDHVVEDTHHPNLRGCVALAAAVLKALADRRILGPASAAIEPPRVADCITHFNLDAQRMAEACHRTSTHYRRSAGYRYDPTPRLRKAARFEEAAERLRAGASLAEVGLPALESLEFHPDHGASPK